MDTASLGYHQTTIDELTYQAMSWPAMEALQMQARLADLAGDAGITLLRRAFQDIDGDQDWPGQFRTDEKTGKRVPHISRGDAAAYFVSSCGQNFAGMAEVLKDCFKRVRCDQVRIGESVAPGEVKPNFDTHFQGRLGHWFQVFAWVTKVSFTLPGSDES